MDATELQLRRSIADLTKRVSDLEEKVEKLEDSNVNFAERVRSILLNYHVIEGSAEDE